MFWKGGKWQDIFPKSDANFEKNHQNIFVYINTSLSQTSTHTKADAYSLLMSSSWWRHSSFICLIWASLSAFSSCNSDSLFRVFTKSQYKISRKNTDHRQGRPALEKAGSRTLSSRDQARPGSPPSSSATLGELRSARSPRWSSGSTRWSPSAVLLWCPVGKQRWNWTFSV